MSHLISIVVPFVNHSNYIDSCWENLQNQTYTNWELIFVNNGSTDESVKLVEAIVSHNAEKVFLVSEEQKGIPFARNKGLEIAKGKYITFLDVDDNFTDTKLEILTNELEKNPEVAMAYGETLRIYKDSRKQVIQDIGIVLSGINYAPALALDWAKTFYRLPQTGATLIKTSVAKEVGGFPQNLLVGNDDVGFHLQIALKYEIIFHPFIAVSYFRHHKSAGALLNDQASVHSRYLDAHLKSTNILGHKYFEKTGDIRLLGIAQRGIFTNVLECYYKSNKLPVPQNVKMSMYLYYRTLLQLFEVLPFSVAKFIYKVTRRIVSFRDSDKYPLK